MLESVTNKVSDFLTDEGKEGTITKAIEKQTARIPSGGFLTFAIASMAVSLGLELFSKKRDPGGFVGLWVPTLLLFGIYNKLVKLEGSDRSEHFGESVA